MLARTNCRSSSNGTSAAVVVEFQQQGVELLHPPELVRAGEAGQTQHGGHRPIDDHLFADGCRFQAPFRRGGGRGGGCDERRPGWGRGLDTDAGDGAGGGIDIPRSGIGDDHAGPRRQGGGRSGGEEPGLALDQAAATGVPAGLPGLDQRIQYIDNQCGRDAGAGFVAIAQQVGEVANLLVGMLIGRDLARRRRGGDAGSFADQQRGDNAGVRRFGRGQFEDDPLPFFLRRRRGQRVEEGLLLGLAQGRETVECRESRRGQMRAAGGAATALVVEHHAAPEQRGGDAHGVGDGAILHDAGDRLAVELHLHAAGQPQATAAGEDARVEDSTEVLGRIRRRHRRGSASGGWRVEGNKPRRRRGGRPTRGANRLGVNESPEFER